MTAQSTQTSQAVPVKLIPGNLQTLNDWNELEHPVVAIDLGFARQDATCGFAFTPDHLFEGLKNPCTRQFGQSVQHLRALFERENAPQKIAIILEAPLSTAWSQHGNPDFRSPLEDGPPERPWYRQPAAVVLTAAFYLLRKALEGQESPKCVELHVFEGFITGDFAGRTHRRDAHNLLRAFLARTGTIGPGGRWESILPLVQVSAPVHPPLIIRVDEADYVQN